MGNWAVGANRRGKAAGRPIRRNAVLARSKRIFWRMPAISPGGKKFPSGYIAIMRDVDHGRPGTPPCG